MIQGTVIRGTVIRGTVPFVPGNCHMNPKNRQPNFPLKSGVPRLAEASDPPSHFCDCRKAKPPELELGEHEFDSEPLLQLGSNTDSERL